MHPAPSLIAFTTLSGLGFGLLFWLGVAPMSVAGWVNFVFYAIGYGLALGGLAASAGHLGHPERALKAFSQWRSSWLSREAWLAALALTVTGIYAFLLIFFGIQLSVLGWIGALLSLATVLATSMIYAQLKTVPRWHHWSTPLLFIVLALAGGALLAGKVTTAIILLLLAGVVQMLWWMDGDRRLARSGTTLASATGLDQGLDQDRGQNLGQAAAQVRAFAPPHTGDNYLTREMAFQVARKHAFKLRIIGIICLAIIPALLLLIQAHHVSAVIAVLAHMIGLAVSRWLFFAEAEHVVGLYYGHHTQPKG